MVPDMWRPECYTSQSPPTRPDLGSTQPSTSYSLDLSLRSIWSRSFRLWIILLIPRALPQIRVQPFVMGHPTRLSSIPHLLSMSATRPLYALHLHIPIPADSLPIRDPLFQTLFVWHHRLRYPHPHRQSLILVFDFLPNSPLVRAFQGHNSHSKRMRKTRQHEWSIKLY